METGLSVGEEVLRLDVGAQLVPMLPVVKTLRVGTDFIHKTCSAHFDVHSGAVSKCTSSDWLKNNVCCRAAHGCQTTKTKSPFDF